MQDCCRLVEAIVITYSNNKLHQTTYNYFRAQYTLSQFWSRGMGFFLPRNLLQASLLAAIPLVTVTHSNYLPGVPGLYVSLHHSASSPDLSDSTSLLSSTLSLSVVVRLCRRCTNSMPVRFSGRIVLKMSAFVFADRGGGVVYILFGGLS